MPCIEFVIHINLYIFLRKTIAQPVLSYSAFVHLVNLPLFHLWLLFLMILKPSVCNIVTFGQPSFNAQDSPVSFSLTLGLFHLFLHD